MTQSDGSGTPAFAERRDRLRSSLLTLPDKPEETAESTLRALWCCAAGRPVSTARAAGEPLPALDADGLAELDALIERRLQGVPLAHLTGRQNFLGIDLIVGPEALLPRRETELLARTAIAAAEEVVAARGSALVADACTGSGNVALAIAGRVPRAHVIGADLSAEAVALARRNAVHLDLQGRAEFACGDLLDPFADLAGRIDVLTCNPPYISSPKVPQMATEIAEYEPAMAFDGGPFGVSILMRLLAGAPRLLAPGGMLAFEVGHGQGPGLLRRLTASASYGEPTGVEDDDGTVRVVVARRAADQ